ncbi:MAG: hypothetical protein ACKVKF_01570 [Rhodobacterales bacterium]|uniref:hypothetical protein n=1 Tax=Puniceibacterium antarcticum TaxID=1206336 RepID=UPI00117B69F8|nr:hypothetical protein [Puniceibacterium antarcticum]
MRVSQQCNARIAQLGARQDKTVYLAVPDQSLKGVQRGFGTVRGCNGQHPSMCAGKLEQSRKKFGKKWTLRIMIIHLDHHTQRFCQIRAN